MRKQKRSKKGKVYWHKMRVTFRKISLIMINELKSVCYELISLISGQPLIILSLAHHSIFRKPSATPAVCCLQRKKPS